MKYKNHTCPNCNAPLPVIDDNQNLVKCEYCGTMINLMLSDAEIKQQETELKEKMFYAQQEEKEQKKEEQRQQTVNHKKEKNTLLFATIAFLVMWFLFQSSIWGIAFFIALVLFIRTCRKEKNESRISNASFDQGNRSDHPTYRSIPVNDDISSKDRLLAFFLCLILGTIGLHHFYVGRIGKGILYLFTFGLFGIGVIVDLILIVSGKFKDRDGRYLQ